MILSQIRRLPNIPVPPPSPKGNYGELVFQWSISLFDSSYIPGSNTTYTFNPPSFDELNLSYGYVLYRTKIPAAGLSDLAVLEARGVRDRAIVYVNRVSSNVRIQGVLQKFCVVQPFSTRSNTVMSQQHAHVTEGIPSARAKFCSNQLKTTQ